MRSFLLLCMLLELPLCYSKQVPFYDGPERPENEVCTIRSSHGWYQGTLMMWISIDKHLTRRPGKVIGLLRKGREIDDIQDNITLLPGEHSIEFRISGTEIWYANGRRYQVYLDSPSKTLKFNCEAGHTYKTSYVINKTDQSWTPVITDKTKP